MELNEIIYEMIDECPFCESEKIIGTIDSIRCLDCGEVFQ